MEKKPFVTKEQLEDIVKQYPTPFHLYDEKGIRENARKVKQAFSWNKGYKEYFAVKATPNPYILQILHEEGLRVRLLFLYGTDDVGSLRHHGRGDYVLVECDTREGI